ncbi:phospholipid-transporting ATPase ABCA3-like [Musca vetustissima]|uniref:phospholipid-transporting ATPase ABCA3-like n=1 Tax=Musca vetustissima TaxID=27455 RepID=UPI002AB65806|nr:phospholipid-transporting ATPase ABCA3-like [Musca vetustissima]
MAHIGNWEKFKLLTWKNWLLQWHHKIQFVIEILAPVVFALLMVLVRMLVVAEPKDLSIYPPQNIDNIDLFKKEMSLLQFAKPVTYSLQYSPDNPFLKNIVCDAAKSLNLTCQGYPDAAALEFAMVSNSYLAGVQFDDSWSNLTDYPQKFAFSLRYPSELRTDESNLGMTWLTMKLFMPLDLSGPRNPSAADGGLPVGYIRESFLPVQHAISMAYAKLVTQRTDLPEVTMQRYPYPAYIYDPLLEGMASFVPLIILLSFIYPCSNIVRNITAEKEKQLKEVMKIMGLDNWLHWTSWFCKNFILLAISAILVTIIMKIEWSNGVAVLTHADWSVLLFFFLIYVITSICFCFMMATFFSKASTAAAVTGLIWFIAYMPFSFMFQTYDELSLGTKLGWCLISNTAMGLGLKLIMLFEGTGEGFQWSNLFEPVNIDDDLTVGYIILMMLASCVLYIAICLYVEQIFPGDFGVPKKWNFIFTRSFWFGDREYIGVEDIPGGHVERKNPDAFEPEPAGKHIGLQVRNLKKRFGDKEAVRGVSVNMYEDEITVLLGHNGAGKTTTISMLTGMFPPTSGTAIINGSDIRTNIEGARMSLGICPQHNVLFDDLSVADHLIFFSRLKGLKGDAITQEVNKYIRMIELEDKANVASSKLSGGMKRKLSVCCALTGNTKVVLCDEPSSGMDPSARRQLWDLLQSEKVGRTVLLTTHFMDEADVLGDRIAIMCGGELKCHGTSFFLKKKYGSGYKLICVKRDGCKSEELTALLQKYVPNIQPVADIGAELSYELPDKYSHIFEEMFRDLENSSDDLKLNGYGIGITSLEEVFMKVGAEGNAATNSETNNKQIANNGMNGAAPTAYPEDDVESITSDSLFSENTRLLKGVNLLRNQWDAMILKKVLHTWRNKLLFIIQNLMPIFFVVMTIIITRTQGTFRPLEPMTMSLTQYPVAVTVLDTAPDVVPGSLLAKIAGAYKTVATSYGSDYELELTGNKNFTEYILDLGRSIQVRINSRYLASASIRGNNSIVAWLNNQPLHTAPLTANLVHNAIIKAAMNESYEITVTNAPLPYTTETVLKQLNVGNNLGTQLSTNLCFCFCFVSAFYILFLIKERESRSKLLQFVGGVNVWVFWISQFLWDIMTFTLTALIVVFTIACFQEDGFSTFSDLARYFLVILIFGFSVLPFTYLMSLFFAEPSSGFGKISIINIFCGMALFIAVAVMSIDYLGTKDTADLLGWIFRVFPHFSLALGLNKLYVNVATREACSNPVISILPDALRCQLVPKCCYTTPYFAWKEPGILPETVYLVATFVVFFTILICREYGILNELIYKWKQRNFKPTPPAEDAYHDDDVEAEKEKILRMSQSELQSQNLVLDRVTKYYDSFLAVNQISLCVKPVECFGLLGVNGAGKTTTFKMMTGDERITSGTAYVKGMNLAADVNKIYKEIGYCPQFDALLDDLTGRETLRIFCLLRGVQRDRIDYISLELAKSFGFMKHLDKPTKAYSGGNKRKLSTALAVIGSPSVIYLDEPTSGMDPAARRQLWNMVCRIRDSGKSIILTSHSMEECEALCTRLAIMVNGEFKCIGSTQHLKNKFSKGLILKIKVKRNTDAVKSGRNSVSLAIESTAAHIREQDIETVKSFIETEFPQSILQENYMGILTFYIPLSSIKWSQIFGLMESNRDRLNIEDYSISQTTLEEIFLEFAKYQREDSRQTAKSYFFRLINN